MNELDLFRDFRRGVAAPSTDAKRQASAVLAGAVAGAHMPSTRDRRLGRSPEHAVGRRRRVLVLAVAALVVVVVGAASALGVRAFFLDRGFIGLSPKGAAPSAPKSGELVVYWEGFSATLPRTFVRDWVYTHVRVWVYADGRIIWDRRGPTQVPEGANEFNSGYLEQRLTPEGVERMRSEVAGLFDRSRTLLESVPADDDPWQWPPPAGRLALFVPNDYGSRFGSVELRDGDRLTRLRWGEACPPRTLAPNCVDRWEGTIATPEQLSALHRVDALLTDPASVLPSSAWAERKVRAYVPSHYAVCIDTSPPKDASQLLSLLPARAADLLSDKSPTRFKGDLVEAREAGRTVVIGRSVTYCFKLATEEAREVADAVSGLDPEPGWRDSGLAYRVAEAVDNLDPTRIWFEPYFPHGQFTFSGPFG